MLDKKPVRQVKQLLMKYLRPLLVISSMAWSGEALASTNFSATRPDGAKVYVSGSARLPNSRAYLSIVSSGGAVLVNCRRVEVSAKALIIVEAKGGPIKVGGLPNWALCRGA